MSSQLPFSTNFYLAFDKQLQERGRKIQQMMGVPAKTRTIYGSEAIEKPTRPASARKGEADRFLDRGREMYRLLEVPPFVRTAYHPQGCVMPSLLDLAASASAGRTHSTIFVKKAMKKQKRAAKEPKEERKDHDGTNPLVNSAIQSTAQALVELTRAPIDPYSLLTDIMDFSNLNNFNFFEGIFTGTAPVVSSIGNLPLPGQEDEECELEEDEQDVIKAPILFPSFTLF